MSASYSDRYSEWALQNTTYQLPPFQNRHTCRLTSPAIGENDLDRPVDHLEGVVKRHAVGVDPVGHGGAQAETQQRADGRVVGHLGGGGAQARAVVGGEVLLEVGFADVGELVVGVGAEEGEHCDVGGGCWGGGWWGGGWWVSWGLGDGWEWMDLSIV